MKTTTIAMMTGLALLIALPISAQRLAAQDMFFYPSKGQSPERQNTDRSECHIWAVQQSGFDPANPPAHAATLPAPAPQGGALRGAACGAAAGAAVGALGGTFRRVDQRRDQAQQQTAAQQQYDAQIAQQRNNYNRALAACMQGRGYSIN
jgi:ferric-dicitrate binding protein FerR (iron transport regulator)